MRIRRLLIPAAAAALVLLVVPAFAQEEPAGAEAPAFEPAPPAKDTAAAPAAAPPAAAEGPAATETPPGEAPADDQAPPPRKDPFKGWGLPLMMVGVFVLMYFFMGRSRRKQETKRKQMLAELKKGDKITTIGGIVGTVMEVREDEVTVKVDETNNTRMKFARWSIRGVGAEAKQEKPEDKR